MAQGPEIGDDQEALARALVVLQRIDEALLRSKQVRRDAVSKLRAAGRIR